MKNLIFFQAFIASNEDSFVTNPFKDSSGSRKIECMEILVPGLPKADVRNH